jgi:hypothetical protein
MLFSIEKVKLRLILRIKIEGSKKVEISFFLQKVNFIKNIFYIKKLA